MNEYERYLEDLLEMKEKELNMYKKFIEERLGCAIQKAVKVNQSFNRGRIKENCIEIITIPESKMAIKID